MKADSVQGSNSDVLLFAAALVNILKVVLGTFPKYVIADITKLAVHWENSSCGLINFSVNKAWCAAGQDLGHYETSKLFNKAGLYFVFMPFGC